MRFEDQDYCNSEISHLDLYKGKGYGAHEVGKIKELFFSPWFLIILFILFITFLFFFSCCKILPLSRKYLDIACFIFPLLQMKTFLCLDYEVSGKSKDLEVEVMKSVKQTFNLYNICQCWVTYASHAGQKITDVLRLLFRTTGCFVFKTGERSSKKFQCYCGISECRLQILNKTIVS